MCAQQGSGEDNGRGEGGRRDQIGSGTHKTVYLALLASVGLILFIFESYVPYPLPWMRLGLGNVASLLALFLFGAREALLVTLVRAILGTLVVGKLLTPSFVLTFCGGLVSVAVMSLVFKLWYPWFSAVGVSIFGALGHNLTQLFVVWVLFIKQVQIAWLLPLFLLSSVATGFVTGAAAYLVLGRLWAFSLQQRTPAPKSAAGPAFEDPKNQVHSETL